MQLSEGRTEFAPVMPSVSIFAIFDRKSTKKKR